MIAPTGEDWQSLEKMGIEEDSEELQIEISGINSFTEECPSQKRWWLLGIGMCLADTKRRVKHCLANLVYSQGEVEGKMTLYREEHETSFQMTISSLEKTFGEFLDDAFKAEDLFMAWFMQEGATPKIGIELSDEALHDEEGLNVIPYQNLCYIDMTHALLSLIEFNQAHLVTFAKASDYNAAKIIEIPPQTIPSNHVRLVVRNLMADMFETFGELEEATYDLHLTPARFQAQGLDPDQEYNVAVVLWNDD